MIIGTFDDPVDDEAAGILEKARCLDHPMLREAAQNGQVVVGAMTGAELRQAVVCPAWEAGLDLEPGLVDVLLRDLGVTADGYEQFDEARDRWCVSVGAVGAQGGGEQGAGFGVGERVQVDRAGAVAGDKAA